MIQKRAFIMADKVFSGKPGLRNLNEIDWQVQYRFIGGLFQGLLAKLL
jgi:hypothetical protein